MIEPAAVYASRVQPSSPKTSVQLTPATLPEPMPTILCRKIILTDIQNMNIGAIRQQSVDNPFDEHFGANQRRG